MRRLKFATVAMALITLVSCGKGVTNEPANEKGFTSIEESIKSEFGDGAYFTDLSILYDESYGNSMTVTTTNDPASLKMGEWVFSQGGWTQTSEVTLELPEGTEAVDFMYQLTDKINLRKLGGLTEKSIEQLKAEKNIESPTLSIAYIKYPDNGNESKAEYVVDLKPEGGGTSFVFSYTLDGELIDMDY